MVSTHRGVWAIMSAELERQTEKLGGGPVIVFVIYLVIPK